MSETLHDQDLRSYDGFVRVAERPAAGMVSLRADLSDSTVIRAIRSVSGGALPDRQTIVFSPKATVAWMSPDELLILTDYSGAPGIVDQIGKALAGQHHLVAEVSDARAVFRLEGAAWRQVLAKLSPADVTEAGLQPGTLRRSRLAQVAAAFWIKDAETAELICFRSVADYVYAVLCNAARPGSQIEL